MRYGQGSGGEKRKGKNVLCRLAGVVVELNSTLSIEIGLRLKFNTKTTLFDRFFTGYVGLLGVSGRCGGLNPVSGIEMA